MAKRKRRKRGSILYLTREGFRNTWANRLMSIASISVLLSCLVVIGTAFMAIVNMNAMMENIQDQNVIMVFVDDDGRAYMYYCSSKYNERGAGPAVGVASSDDMVSWRDEGAYTFDICDVALESPFVMKRGGKY